MMLLLGVCGSAAKSHRTRALIDATMEGAREFRSATTVRVIDLSDTRLEFCDGRPVEQYSQATRDTLQVVQEAGAFIFGTPMYRGTLTGSLKNLIDLIPKDYICGKAAGLVATGATDHHYLGLDIGMRTIMAFFQVHTVPGILYGGRFEVKDGKILDPKLYADAKKLGADTVLMAEQMGGRGLGPAIF
jgi:NAD(P)H-dependent FMN reductase